MEKLFIVTLYPNIFQNLYSLIFNWVKSFDQYFHSFYFSLTSTVTATGKSWNVLRVDAASAHLVPDADVGPFGQQQLHLVHVLVLRRPDDGRPSSVVLEQQHENWRRWERATRCSRRTDRPARLSEERLAGSEVNQQLLLVNVWQQWDISTSTVDKRAPVWITDELKGFLSDEKK